MVSFPITCQVALLSDVLAIAVRAHFNDSQNLLWLLSSRCGIARDAPPEVQMARSSILSRSTTSLYLHPPR
jgi:hypothetical protein